MLRSFISLSTGRRVVAAGLTAAALSTAACSDSATGPRRNAGDVAGPNSLVAGIPGNPQLATFISVHIVDVSVKNVTEKAVVRFRWFQPQDSVFVQDNSALDLDPTIGVVKIAAPKAAGYEGCVRGTTAHFAADTAGVSYPTCNSKFWLSFDINLGNVYMRRKPQFTVKMIDAVTKQLLPGAAVHMYLGGDPWKIDVVDGQLGDEPQINDGMITVTVPKPGQLVYSVTKLPTGKYELADLQSYLHVLSWEEKGAYQFYFKQVAY